VSKLNNLLLHLNIELTVINIFTDGTAALFTHPVVHFAFKLSTSASWFSTCCWLAHLLLSFDKFKKGNIY
jgi:hypothetical protein